MKKILSFFAGSLLALTAAADTANPQTFTAQQPDGTTLTLRLVGDEHFHYFLDVNTGRRMQLADDGTYTAFPEADFNRLRTAAQQRMANANAMRWERMEQFQRRAGIVTNPAELSANGPRKVGTFNNNLSGQKKGLVILANFSDLAHSLDDPQLEWDKAFNEVGYSKNGHVGSVHDYFYDQSYGKFDLEFDVVGPVTVARKMSYYGQNNSYGSDAHAAEMVAEACKLVNDIVDFKDYDWDGNGEVDQVYVIYAGYGESSGAPAETIWPHEYWLEYGYGQKLYLDGVYINTYACSCELRGNGRGQGIMNGIGTACHEFSHCIGYPDFYDVNYEGGFGMDQWDVMSSGGYNGPTSSCEVPVGYTAYERWMAGWLEPIEIADGCEIENMPNIQDEPVAYILRSKAKGTLARPTDEYFLLENRQAEKWFAYPASAHGMLVSHVNYTKNTWTGNSVNTGNNHGMGLVPAGKTFGSYNSTYKSWYPTADDYRSMLFPGSKRVKEWTDESHYDCGGKLYNRNTDGTYKLGLPLTEIQETDGKISFVVKGGTDLGYRWNVNFDAGTGTTDLKAWQQKENNEKVKLPTASCTAEGWRFLGWTPTKVNATSDECPAELYAAGAEYKPSADVTLYAVYGTTAEGPIVDEYRLTDELTNGQKYLLLSKNATSSVDVIAVDPTKLTLNTATKTPEGTVIDVNFEAPLPIVSNPAEELIWTARIDGDHTMLTDAKGEYLLISNAGLTLSDEFCFVGWDTTYGLYGTNSSTGSRYYIHNSNGKFSVSATKQKSSRVFLYALIDFRKKDVIYSTYPGATEGIESVLAPATDSTTIYDLSGRKVNAPVHGVSIEGGKKVIR